MNVLEFALPKRFLMHITLALQSAFYIFMFQRNRGLVVWTLTVLVAASNSMWSNVVKLNSTEFGLGDDESPHPQTPPSNSAPEVEPMT